MSTETKNCTKVDFIRKKSDKKSKKEVYQIEIDGVINSSMIRVYPFKTSLPYQAIKKVCSMFALSKAELQQKIDNGELKIEIFLNENFSFILEDKSSIFKSIEWICLLVDRKWFNKKRKFFPFSFFCYENLLSLSLITSMISSHLLICSKNILSSVLVCFI